jgi:hypothetical protein
MRKYITPLTIATSFFVLISGLMLLFDIQPGAVLLMHEWIGLIFCLAVLAHVFMHRRSFFSHFKNQRKLGLMLVICFFSFSMLDDGNVMDSPARKIFTSVDRAPLTTIALLLQKSTDELIAKAQNSGVIVQNKLITIEEIARFNHLTNDEIVTILFQ